MSRWAWTALLVVASTVGEAPAASGAISPHGVPASGVGLSGTSVLSVRRFPGWVEAGAARARLDGSLAQITAHATGASLCVMVTQGSVTQGSGLYALDADKELIPASNMKILTATAVLDRLGPSYRMTTRVLGDRAPEDGVVYGNIYLIGAGNPLLRTDAYEAQLQPRQPLYTSLDRLAALVRKAGVTEITGEVVGDDSRYDAERTVPTWKPVYSTEGDVGPLSALDVDDGFVPKPPPKKSASTAPALAFAAASDPPATAAAVFASLLRAAGVEVLGAATGGLAPPGAPQVASISSPPLSGVVDSMLTVSDDTAAELLTKELGVVVSKEGTTVAGTAAVRADLARDGLPVSQMVNLDGSGLDREDLASCNLLVAALDRAGPGSVLAKGLPVAGRTGTLSDRLLGTPAAGRLRAKTGTLDDVSSLSGFVTPGAAPTAALSRSLVFSVIVNGLGYPYGQDIVDKIAVALAQYPQVPALALIEPSESGS